VIFYRYIGGSSADGGTTTVGNAPAATNTTSTGSSLKPATTSSGSPKIDLPVLKMPSGYSPVIIPRQR
jgi:hypothetical protein